MKIIEKELIIFFVVKKTCRNAMFEDLIYLNNKNIKLIRVNKNTIKNKHICRNIKYFDGFFNSVSYLGVCQKPCDNETLNQLLIKNYKNLFITGILVEKKYFFSTKILKDLWTKNMLLEAIINIINIPTVKIFNILNTSLTTLVISKI